MVDWSSAELSATDRALAAANKPMVLGRNWMRDIPFVANDPHWNKNTGAWAEGNDEDADAPTKYSYDDYDHLMTYGDANDATWYFLIDLGSTKREFDSIVILNPIITVTTVITVELCDTGDGAFTPATAIATKTVTDATERVVFLTLTDATIAKRFTARWLRLKFFLASTGKPKFGELVISRRRQLKHKPQMPHDKDRLFSNVAVFESASGVRSHYALHKKRRRLVASFTMHEDAYKDDFDTFWETDIDGGTLPFVWIDNPDSAPEAANWMLMENPDRVGPTEGYTKRKIVISAIEHGPNFLALE